MRAVLKTLTGEFEFEFDPKKGGEVLVDNLSDGYRFELSERYLGEVIAYSQRNDDGTYLVTLFPREKWGLQIFLS